MTTEYNNAVVRLLGQDGKPIGAGVLIAERHVLTCAHVVNEALGLHDESQDIPTQPVKLDFPYCPTNLPYAAKVVHWSPRRADGRGDIAGLELPIPLPPDVKPPRLIDQPELWNTKFRVLGFPTGYDSGVHSYGHILGLLPNDCVQLEAQGEYKTLSGFSGAPVWSEQAQGVVGIVVSAERNPKIKAGFMIPTTILSDAWEPIGFHRQLPVPVSTIIPTVEGLFFLTRHFILHAVLMTRRSR